MLDDFLVRDMKRLAKTLTPRVKLYRGVTISEEEKDSWMENGIPSPAVTALGGLDNFYEEYPETKDRGFRDNPARFKYDHRFDPEDLVYTCWTPLGDFARSYASGNGNGTSLNPLDTSDEKRSYLFKIKTNPLEIVRRDPWKISHEALPDRAMFMNQGDHYASLDPIVPSERILDVEDFGPVD